MTKVKKNEKNDNGHWIACISLFCNGQRAVTLGHWGEDGAFVCLFWGGDNNIFT